MTSDVLITPKPQDPWAAFPAGEVEEQKEAQVCEATGCTTRKSHSDVTTPHAVNKRMQTTSHTATTTSHDPNPPETAHPTHSSPDCSDHDARVTDWLRQGGYFLPDESDQAAARSDVKHKYRPPRSDIWGVVVACTVIGVWAVLFWHAMFHVRLPWDVDSGQALATRHSHTSNSAHSPSSDSLQFCAANGTQAGFTQPQSVQTTTCVSALPPMGLNKQIPETQAPASTVKASSWLHVVALFFALEFMCTGLFITTHDAMHGTIAMRHRRLNDALGQIAISLYAWFDYSMLHRKHWEHHNHTGVVNKDPDFHRGNPNVLVWFVRFMMEYSTLWQFVRIALWAAVMQACGARIANVYVYMTAAPILAAFRLFYYGTYVPHHPDPGPDAATKPMPWTVSRTSRASRLLSFLTCYHFDLHWEHHRWPYAPWWQLPQCRELSGR